VTRTEDTKEFMRVLKEQACWANVCTEPGMVAYMASKAAALAGEEPVTIEVHLSGGILKNALSAGLPHTTRKGPDVAAAAGTIARKPEKGLTILGEISEEEMTEALRIVDQGRVIVKWDARHDGIYGKCILKTANHTAEVKVSGSHTGLAELILDGSAIAVSGSSDGSSGLSSLRDWTFNRLIDVVMALDPSEFGWLAEGADSCVRLSEAGSASSATSLGAIPEVACTVLRCDSTSLTEIASQAFRAIDTRMSGLPWPVVTSAGSGNQGIMLSIPVWLIASRLGLSDEKKLRAVVLAHGVNMLVKAYTGEVSASCGGISVGAGLAASICWMAGGSREQMAEAVTEALASLCGMICDGAKATCALKGSLAVMAGIIAGAGASESTAKLRNQGVVGESIDETLERMEAMSRRVFSGSDTVLLELAGIDRVDD
jgi:L-cysteine desulfidase